MDKIINIAVVAHVDVGKSTLVDALLKQNGAKIVTLVEIITRSPIEINHGHALSILKPEFMDVSFPIFSPCSIR